MSDDKKCCGGDKPNSEKSSGCCGGDGKKKSCCKKILLLVILVAVGVGAFVYLKDKKSKDSPADIEKAEAESVEPENPNPVLAVIDGDEIKRLEVLNAINAMPAQMKQIPMEQLFPMVLEQVINNKIIDKKAAKAGLAKDKSVLEQLEKAKDQIIRVKFLENLINEKVTDERLQAKYDEYVKNFPDVEEVKAAHILVEDEKAAKAIIRKLNKGADFAELAKENSKDGSSENGGDLGYFTKTDVVPAFGEAAFATKVGEYTKMPVKSDFGYHIIKVEEKRKRPPAEFAQIKPYMEQEMHRSVLDEAINEWKAEIKIERFDINGNPLPAENEELAPEEASPAAGEEVEIEEIITEENSPEAE